MATVEELEKRIGDLEDMRAIERLQAEYWDTLDAKDWDGLRACLVEDFVFVNNTTGGLYERGCSPRCEPSSQTASRRAIKDTIIGSS